MPLEIKPYIGIGEVKFGMTENEIISIMGEPTEKKDNHWHSRDPHIVLIYDSIHVHFKINAANTLENIIVKNRKRKKKDEIIFLQEPLFISAKALVIDYYHKYQKDNFECVLNERNGMLCLPEFGLIFQSRSIMRDSLNKSLLWVCIFNLNYSTDKYFCFIYKNAINYGTNFTLEDYLKLPQEQRAKSIMMADEN